MSSIESVVELIELIRNHPDACNWTGGLSSADLALAEEQLGTRFPPSYRYFLTELGSCEAGSEEFLGIYWTPAMGDRLLGTVDATLDARSDPRFPGNLLVIQYDGMGGLVSLDAAQPGEDGEMPVVVWHPDSADRGGAEKLADDFGAYALRLCTRALMSVPESSDCGAGAQQMDELLELLDAVWGEESGFLGKLRAGEFDLPAGEAYVRLLAGIPEQGRLIDARLVKLIWFAPLFMEWQAERAARTDEESRQLSRIAAQVQEEVERVLGVP